MNKNVPSRISHLRYIVNALIDKELKSRGIVDLHTSYGSIVYSLQKNGPQTMKELTKEIDRDKSTLTVLIKKLKENSYISLETHKEDKRSKVVSLTNKGKSIELNFEDISLNLNEALWKDIKEEDAQAFVITLNRMIKNIERELEK
jgi:DNA-binding MarR family transcriptional regulator